MGIIQSLHGDTGDHMIKSSVLVIVGCLVFTISGWCLEPIHIGVDNRPIPVGPYAEIMQDPSGKVSVQDLLLPEYDRLFEPLGSDTFGFGLASDVTDPFQNQTGNTRRTVSTDCLFYQQTVSIR